MDLYAKTTEWAEMNRGCMDTNFTGANSDRSFTFPSVENTGTVYSLIHNSVSENTTDSGISVYINGNLISFAQAPYIENGTTMVPMRAIFEELGAEVDYNGETKTITAVKGEKTIILTVGSKDAYVNGSVFTLQNSPVILEGTTMIPLRFVAEALDTEINWNESTKTIDIN
ncbi:MAG: copper amine oxidase N-terminal domain-containing protein [Clostridiales bacterium]|nr:copper amine oxidase N-terminal domain-containing protein [Clostridiales bacterium]